MACNPADRCYHCKNAIFSLIRRQAAADGWPVLIDGTNASDDAGDRPGNEKPCGSLEVRSPLRECGITKKEVRRRSMEAGLFTWDKPAYACLATRIPTGGPLPTAFWSGWNKVRTLCWVRFHRFPGPGAGRCGPTPAAGGPAETALDRREKIRAALAPAFSQVLLDLEPRKKEGE